MLGYQILIRVAVLACAPDVVVEQDLTRGRRRPDTTMMTEPICEDALRELILDYPLNTKIIVRDGGFQ